jgi:hypothetical protein
MIQHTKKMKNLIYVLLLFLNLSCKSNTEKSEKNNSVSKVIDTDTVEKDESPKSVLINGESYKFYRSYYLQADANDIPEISQDKVVEKFRDMKVELSKDIISIDGIESNYTIEKMDSRNFFMTKYQYNYYVKAFKNGFDIDIINNVNYLQLDLSNNSKSPFKDYFLDAGTTIFINDCLFLNFKRYIICFKKEDKKKVSDKKSCGLPFDFEKVKICSQNCNQIYPQYTSMELPNIAKITVELTQYEPDIIYLLNNGNLKFQTFIVQYSGDAISQTLINIKDGKLISSQNIGYEMDGEDESYQSFIIDTKLNIDIIDINYKTKLRKVLNSFKINSDGKIIKIK